MRNKTELSEGLGERLCLGAILARVTEEDVGHGLGSPHIFSKGGANGWDFQSPSAEPSAEEAHRIRWLGLAGPLWPGGCSAERFGAFEKVEIVAFGICKEDHFVLARVRLRDKVHALPAQIRVDGVEILNADGQVTMSRRSHSAGTTLAFGLDDLDHGTVRSPYEHCVRRPVHNAEAENGRVPFGEGGNIGGGDGGVFDSCDHGSIMGTPVPRVHFLGCHCGQYGRRPRPWRPPALGSHARNRI